MPGPRRSGKNDRSSLIDTGADLNFVRKGLYPSPIRYTDLQVKGANGGLVDIIGIQTVKAKISNQHVQFEAHVLRHAFNEVILGMPFLLQQDGVIDLTKGRMYFGRNPRRTAYWQHQPKTDHPVPEFQHGLEGEQAERFKREMEPFHEIF